MMRAIIENYGGGPVGLETLAATIGEESVTLEDVYEPYLMQMGFLTRTPRGRCVTRKAYEHLHLAFAGQPQHQRNDQISLRCAKSSMEGITLSLWANYLERTASVVSLVKISPLDTGFSCGAGSGCRPDGGEGEQARPLPSARTPVSPRICWRRR